MLVLSKHFKLQQKSEEGADSGWLNALYLVFDADDVLRAKLHSQWHEQNHHWSYYQLQLCCGNAELKSWCNQRLLNGKFKLHLVEEMRRDPVCKLISKLFQVMNQCCKMQSQQTWPNVTVSFRSFKTDWECLLKYPAFPGLCRQFFAECGGFDRRNKGNYSMQITYIEILSKPVGAEMSIYGLAWKRLFFISLFLCLKHLPVAVVLNIPLDVI